ncbi:hypothetical protein AXF42_Ash018107 [Apostasia shenzhenica]|uniref:Uncharacterized protein n=1 Tax=Apostasia shenzhenica TaxID=1088818 RepID=A0A2I0AEX1_9ASPA|nr:hypothetical protein AXF42_Ash018107 [Apostasia shenzhenica]
MEGLRHKNKQRGATTSILLSDSTELKLHNIKLIASHSTGYHISKPFRIAFEVIILSGLSKIAKPNIISVDCPISSLSND